MKFKLRSRTTVFVHDLLMVPLAWLAAFWLRFNLETESPEFFYQACFSLPGVILIQVLVFWKVGLYRGMWRFSSIMDMERILKAAIIGLLLIALCFLFINRLSGIPRAILPLYGMNLVALLAVPRFCYRVWKERVQMPGSQLRALIVGAGSAGEMLVRDLLANPGNGYQPIVFADDKASKQKREIRGVPVVGSIAHIPQLIEQWNIESILIAIPSATDGQMRRIVEICESCRIPFETLPSVQELLTGCVSRQDLRHVAIEDILGRDSVRLNWEQIHAHLENQAILVTGGGGSIGSELCRQLARARPSRLIVFDQSEFNLYRIHEALKQQYPELNYVSILGDVTDRGSVERVIRQHVPDIIFHAAAYKHVPLLEQQIREAVHNNLLGTRIVAQAAIAGGVKRFVLISTDKAVNPVSIMGATKRAAEVLCQYLNQQQQTRFITVRFGNVLDSAGSVVPLFREQISRGGPVTVTHPDIRRYFMTIHEACQLIMQAETLGQGGEVFVLDMGQPIKIVYLAEQMIRLSGKLPGDDIAIEYIGLRPGEKLCEELFYEQESLLPTGFDKLKLAKVRINAAKDWMDLLDALQQACAQADDVRISLLMQMLVPEFCIDLDDNRLEGKLNYRLDIESRLQNS